MTTRLWPALPALILASLALTLHAGTRVTHGVSDLDRFLRDARAGDTDAQFNMGVALQFGRGIERDPEKAKYWYQKAAHRGHAEAQFNLAWLLEQSLQFDQAFHWYREAAAQGLAKAQRAVALMYGEGRGVARNDTAAARWCELAARQGHREAQYDLGVAYDMGKGVERDLSKAIEWWTRAARQGHPNAQYNLGVIYEYGDEVAVDLDEAIMWYRRAASQNHPDAQFNLAAAYINGKGVEKDFVHAYMWLEAAARNGLSLADDVRERLASHMSGKQVSESRLLAKELALVSPSLRE